jgi:acyl-CoA thioesterase FadM
MKPSLRLLKVLAAPTVTTPNTLGRPTVDHVQAELVTRWCVLPCDIDLFGHMNNSRYALLMDYARVHYLRSAGLLTLALKERWVMPTSMVNLDFHRPLKPFERFEIQTQLLSWDDRWIFMRQTFRTWRRPDRTVATGYVKSIIRSPSGVVAPERPVRLMCGRDVQPPALPYALWARFNTDRSSAVGGHTAPKIPRDNAHSLVDLDSQRPA